MRNKILRPATFVLCLVFLSVTSGFALRSVTSYWDTANFFSFIDKQTLLSPLSSDYAEHHNGIIELISSSSSEVCQAIDGANRYSNNFFRIHAFIFPTVIALSGWMLPIPTNWLAGFWLSTSLVGGLLAQIIFLRKLNCPRVSVAILLLNLLMFPVLNQAFLGQMYVDLLIFGPACASLLLVWWMKFHSTKVWPWVVLLLTVLITISERGSYLAGIIGLMYTSLLYGKKIFKIREARFVALAGLTGWIWMVLWTRFINQNTQLQQQSLRGSFARLQALLDDPTRPLFTTFLMTSIVFIGVSVFSGRGFVILLAAIAPNLLITTGGAELTGFGTHYHQTYLGVIVGTTSIGFAVLSSRLKVKDAMIRNALAIALALVILSATLFSWSTFGLKLSLENIKQRTQSLVLTPYLDNDRELRDKSQHLHEIATYVRSLNPKIISMPEELAPVFFLAGFRDVEYWPIGVGAADVVVAPVQETGPVVYPYGDIWGNGEALKTCTYAALEQDYKIVREYNSLRVYQDQD